MFENRKLVNNLFVITNVVQELTHTSNRELNETKLNDLRNFCKNSQEFTERIYSSLLDCLKKPHSEIRYNAFQTCCQLFKDFSHFRTLLVDDLKHILELTAEINSDLPLPPPKNVANDLKQLTLQVVKEWNETFGSEYRRLELCYNFLKSHIKVDLFSLNSTNERVRQRKEAEEKRMQIVNNEKIRLVKNEMKDIEPTIRIAVQSLDSCIHLLVPTLDDFFITIPEEIISKDGEGKKKVENLENITHSDTISENDKEDTYLREAGFIDKNYSIDIHLDSENGDQIVIKETKDNCAIIENARDQFVLLNNKYLPIVKKWINITTKVSGEKNLLKKLIDLRTELDALLIKYKKLLIQQTKPISVNENTDDSDMEEVPIVVPSADEIITDNILQVFNTSKNSTISNSATVNCDQPHKNSNEENVEEVSTEECKTKLLQIAPKLPYDTDLYDWVNEPIPNSKMIPSNTKGHRFWLANKLDDTESISFSDSATNSRTCVIELTGNSEHSKWECRVQLHNGKLCSRRDKVKCPFHGIIVSRDETGRCINPDDEKREKKLLEEKQRTNPDWQDPVLLAKIKQATGVDLKMPERGKRKKKRVNDLTDLKAVCNTPYNRLSKKIFKKSTMKRVAKIQDKIDQRKFKDKYRDQFHYMHDTA